MAEFIKAKPTTFRNKPVGVVAADTGAVQLGNAVADLGNSMQKIFWEEARKDAIKKDIDTAKTLAVAKDGKIQFEKANFTQVGTPYAEKVLAQRYGDAMGLLSKDKFAELQAKHRFDKDKFDEEASGFIDAHIKSFKDNGMDQYIPDFITKVTNQKVLHSNKILNDTIARDERVAAQNTLLTLEDDINSMTALIYSKANFSEDEAEDTQDIINLDNDIKNTITDVESKINELVAGGHIKAPKAQDLFAALRRSQALGTINNVVDRLGENGDAIKAVEQVFNSKRLSPQLINYVVQATRNKVSPSELKKVFELKDELNLTRTDMAVLAREISNRSGDASKLMKAMELDYSVGSIYNTDSILENTKDNREKLNLSLNNEFGREINSTNFFDLDAATYSAVVSKVMSRNVVPKFAHDLFKADNFLNLSMFENRPPAQKKAMAARVLDLWKNTAYTSTGSPRLQGYDDEYFKFSLIDAAASVNGNDIVGLFDYFSRPNTTKNELDNSVMTSFAKFYPDSNITTVNSALEAILDDADIPRHSWSIMKPYANKLMVFKNAKSVNDKIVEFTKENMKDVLEETYNNIFIEDETVYDFFSKDTSTRTRFTPKRKYTGPLYNKFVDHVNQYIQETTSEFEGLGEDVFLLPDVRNSQFGDQRYTLVTESGVQILNNESTPITFTTREFDKQNSINVKELEKIMLNQAYKKRLASKGAKLPPSDLGLYNPDLEAINVEDFIGTQNNSLNYKTTFKSIKNLDAPVMMPEERAADMTFRSEDQKQFEAMTKFGTGADAQRIQTGLKDFKEYVDGLGENYLERKVGNKGYDNPSWQLLSEYKFTKDSVKDVIQDVKNFFTPDVAVEVQDSLIDIINYSSEKEGFRVMPYRDVNTLSIGRGFNIRDLTERDFNFIPKDLATELKTLQKDLKSKSYTSEELLAKEREFKRNLSSKGIRGLLQQSADKIYTAKIKDIYDQYVREFDNFGTLSSERQKSLIDFSYQLGHENVKNKFPLYYESLRNAINTDDIDIRNYHFRQAGFHQAYNIAQFGNTKTKVHMQTGSRVRDRVSLLGYHVRDVDFMLED